MSASAARLLVSAPLSGGGKTTFTCGLMRALMRRGLRVQACKCGPDYIDPMFHAAVVGAPSRNLDLFFSDEAQVRALVANSAAAGDVLVIEGAMGYYDGIAVSDEASAWDVARVTETPAILVVDGRGRARSIAAEVLGFTRFREQSRVAGVVLNRVSAQLYPRLKEVIESETGVPVFGYLPVLPECGLESRHLGLVAASEVPELRAKVERIAAVVEECVDLDGLLRLAEGAAAFDGIPLRRATGFGLTGEPASIGSGDGSRVVGGSCFADMPSQGALSQPPAARAPEEQLESLRGRLGNTRAAGEGVRVAVAWDEAFCFYYADTLSVLAELGAELIRFSPMGDASLPDGVRGLYVGGGYPELHAQELSENAAMREAIAAAIRSGMPTIAECGGFLYLHDQLEGEDGAFYPQVGIVAARAYRTQRLGRFGYVTLTAQHDGLLAAAGEELRAHEFHYWESEQPGTAYRAQKPQSARAWECCMSTPTLHAGFPHLYLPAYPQAAQRFLDACRAFAHAHEEA